MNRLLGLAVVLAVITVATSVKEWKNFENGKVYSHKIPTEKEVQPHAVRNPPVVEERLLHSHHRDKKMKNNSPQTADVKPVKTKNAERHRKKSIEEEMHLRPLNERHHKFPNPALLDKIDYANPPSPQISRQKLVKQAKHGKTNNRRRQRGRRLKRNKSEQKVLALLDNNSEITPDGQKLNAEVEHTSMKPNMLVSLKDKKMQMTKEPQKEKESFPLKMASYW